jgi:hypothetical protein
MYGSLEQPESRRHVGGPTIIRDYPRLFLDL